MEMTSELRSSGIGGSDAAVILGLSKWKSPVQLYYEKRGEVEPVTEENEAIYFGKLLEYIVAREYSRRTGEKIARVNRTLRHPVDTFMMAHIDRRVLNCDTGKLLECKTAGKWWRREDWGDSGTSDIPEYYMPQVQHYLAVTGWQFADLAALLAGNDFRVYHLERNDDYIRELVDAEKEFWARVQEGFPPGPTSEEDCRLIWAVGTGETAVADAVISDKVRLLSSVRVSMKELEAEEEALKIEIQKHMAEKTFLIGENGEKLATWKNQETTRLDTTRLKSEAPEVYEKFGKKSVSRVFRIY